MLILLQEELPTIVAVLIRNDILTFPIPVLEVAATAKSLRQRQTSAAARRSLDLAAARRLFPRQKRHARARTGGHALQVKLEQFATVSLDTVARSANGHRVSQILAAIMEHVSMRQPLRARLEATSAFVINAGLARIVGNFLI